MTHAVPVFDLFGHCQEGLLNVGGILCRCLEEWDGELIREFLNTITKISKVKVIE